MTRGHVLGAVMMLMSVATTPAAAQAVAGPEKARPVQGDPGISSLQVLNEAPFPRAARLRRAGRHRRNHNHADATYHVFVLITGQLRLTVEGQPPVDVGPGEALSLKGGVMHTFTNTGKVTATIVEVFGKAPAAAADLAAAEALARALAPPPPGR